MKYSLIKTILFALLFAVSAPAVSQCFEIKSILVDACGEPEGYNEMVRFETGSAPFNTSALNVNWPSNPWKGLIQNAATANIVAQLNASIAAAGGCGQLIQPVGNTIPPNATVILFTSFVLDVSANEFGALSENIYVLFQNNNSTTSGHFANIGTGNRTLTMSVPGCNRSVTYNRALLPAGGDGDVVNFTNGVPSYDNNGCTAPVPVFDVDAGPDQTTCPGTPVLLDGFAEGHTSLNWSAPSGTFSDPSIVNPIYTPDASATGSVILTLTMTGSCANTLTDTVEITIDNASTPDFPTSLTFCSGETVPTLATTSPNGITGSWSPSAINNTTNGTYIFTPDAGQCAASVTLNVTITNAITPDFPTSLTFCSGETVPALATTSPNGITGSWSPSDINNTTNGTYVFTPDAGQCAASTTLNVTITNSVTPDFPTTLTFCSGGSVPALATTSPNGITGSWSPSAINNTTNGTYIFTPDAGQCAASVTLNVTITNAITPDFPTSLTFCSGETVPTLATISPNGITGSWSPSVINNTTNGTYIFTPDAGQCVASTTLNVTITNAITPDLPTTMTFCSGETVPALATTSPNGITGSWSPSVINNTTNGTYIFTPDAGQCAASTTLNVTITNAITPDFPTTLTFCSGETVPTLATTSPNGITGSWSPSVINNTTNGTYIFTPDAGQCASPITLNVSITASTPVVVSGPSTVCAGETISLSADVNGGVWSSSNPAVAAVDAAGTVLGISGGTVAISYTITGGCASPATHTVVIGPRVTPQLENVAICQSGQTVVLNTGLPASGYSFLWTLNGETLSGGGRTLAVSAPGQYSVVATHLSSGCSGTASAQVSLSAPLFATASIAQDFDRIQTISVQVAGGSGQFEFQLNDGPRQSSSYFSGYFDGEYTVTVYDLDGCDTVELTVFALNYPRFFTPNDDGFNDFWNIDGVQEGVIYIFDRYGKLLKQLRAGVNGWDGTYNGYALPATDYWFTLEYLNRDGDTKTFKSHFSLIR